MGQRLLFLSSLLLLITSSTQERLRSLDDLNEKIPLMGASWSPGNGSIGGYYPSFYVGFAPRNQDPQRIHIRTARGNQTRVSVILDNQTIIDYVYDLKYRANLYASLVNDQKSLISVNRDLKNYPDLVSDFLKIVNDELNDFSDQTVVSKENLLFIYGKSLTSLYRLNPGRVFNINIDLNAEFARWNTILKDLFKDLPTHDQNSILDELKNSPQKAIIALNTLVFGRVNFTEKPSDSLLIDFSNLISQNLKDPSRFTKQNVEMFKKLTGNKYNFTTLSKDGVFRSPIQCENKNQCYLNYFEFTAIYPTGSATMATRDKFGNPISYFATPGLWKFIDRSYHQVDHIRSEPYYGWAPKLDFEGIGNGFHNPAVRFSNLSTDLKEKLNIPNSHSSYWSVKRGNVSHGCLRLPLGHVWEMRHILPVANEQMKQVFFFGNSNEDFDLYDIDGDGQLEVMGVKYYISYNLKGVSGLDRREGSDFEYSADELQSFYNRLYGSKNVFNWKDESHIEFINPSVSFPSYLDYQKKSVITHYSIQDLFPLYELDYEQDKVQFYTPKQSQSLTEKSQNAVAKRIVRVLGRARGCSPNSDKKKCGQTDFETEYQSLKNIVK